jgi:hypothetical protein
VDTTPDGPSYHEWIAQAEGVRSAGGCRRSAGALGLDDEYVAIAGRHPEIAGCDKAYTTDGLHGVHFASLFVWP